MTSEQADFLIEACENAGIETHRYDDYSGRSMYGKTTVGVVVPNLLEVLGAVVRHMKAFADEPIKPEAHLENAPFLDNLRWNSLGRDIILY